MIRDTPALSAKFGDPRSHSTARTRFCTSGFSAGIGALFSPPSTKPDRGDNETLRASSFNTSLAQTWREEAETANPEPLLARRENYAADALPHHILYLGAVCIDSGGHHTQKVYRFLWAARPRRLQYRRCPFRRPVFSGAACGLG